MKLWIAQGFGVGRIPVAPGTFGSVVGLAWFALLLWPQNLEFFLVGTVSGLLVSVWLCGEGEKRLGAKDPGCIVLDEITAMPVCFAVWITSVLAGAGTVPSPAYFFNRSTWVVTLCVFLMFRFFDVLKPWPVRQSQKLPGGWGVTIDDLLAAIYVNLPLAVYLLLK